jgi:hypothetical protein
VAEFDDWRADVEPNAARRKDEGLSDEAVMLLSIAVSLKGLCDAQWDHVDAQRSTAEAIENITGPAALDEASAALARAFRTETPR